MDVDRTESAQGDGSRQIAMKLPVVVAVVLALLVTGRAVEYGEPLRPGFHFTPARNFMNDPNGLVYYKGEYHLFYQHNPFGEKWGHMSWGHAVSSDMLHWQHLPVAIPEGDGVMIFSGSAVVDWHNSSGFCQPHGHDLSCLVAIYTSQEKEKETQSIAYSQDRGRTWTKYAGNPVIDPNLKNFRDPKVFWHEATSRWVMVTVLADRHKVRFYGSPDLKKWDVLSEFGPAGATGGVWECPDLFPLPVDNDAGKTRWVLDVNLNPGGIAGGSGDQYFIGSFDGTRFTNDNPPDRTLWADYGKDFYASSSFEPLGPVVPSSLPERRHSSSPRRMAVVSGSGGSATGSTRTTSPPSSGGGRSRSHARSRSAGSPTACA